MRRNKRLIKALLPILFLALIFACAKFMEHADFPENPADGKGTVLSEDINTPDAPDKTDGTFEDDDLIQIGSVPDHSGEAYCVINGGIPVFDVNSDDTAYESYSELDKLGRCGKAEALLGRELMPTEKRESISHVYPSGWVNVPYSFVDGGMLYNRCHLIGFQLAGENDNDKNLVTGTRYMNTEGMLPFENMIADYIKETGNHVLYRVTPIFRNSELVCRGVQIEALSLEDNGEGICFNVYAYNVQPGVMIDYLTGESSLDEDALNSGEQGTYVLNTNSKKFHAPECKGAADISEKNRKDHTGSRELLIAQGFDPCSQCDP